RHRRQRLVPLSPAVRRGPRLLPRAHPAGGSAGGGRRRLMPLIRRDTPEGPVWVRPPYRPEHYSVPAEALHLFERWRGREDVEGTEALLALRDGPFGNYLQVARHLRDGKTWITLLEATREFALEVEATPKGFGAITPLPPQHAYDLACARDALRARPVIRET